MTKPEKIPAPNTLGAQLVGSLRVPLICFLIVMIDGYDSMMVSFLAPLIAKGWGLGPAEIGKIFAVGYAGAIVGAMVSGALTDRAGRKPALLVSLFLAALATASCALAPSVAGLIALRFVAGLGLGGALPAVIALAAEQARPSRRNGTVTLIYIGYPMGAVVGGAVTAALMPYGWPDIFLGAGLVSLLLAAAAWGLPETLTRQAGMPVRGAVAGLRDQFAEGRLVPALMLWLVLFSLLLLTYFLVSWTPSLLVRSGLAPNRAALGGVLLNLGGAVGALAMAPTINRFGPYLPVALMVGAGALLTALLGQDLGAVEMTMAALFLVGVCVIGGQLNCPAMAVALFPERLRGTGGGTAMGVGRLGSIVGPALGGGLIAANLDNATLFAIAAIPAAVAAAAAAVIGLTRRRIDGN